MSSTTRVSEAIARPVRTAAQATPSWIFTEMIDAFLYDLSERQFAALVLFLTLLLGWGQNAWENRREAGLFLRDVPPKTVTVTEQPQK